MRISDWSSDVCSSDLLITLGDVGYLDAEGYLFLTGRNSDVIISGGVNIYPAEIEAEIMAIPGVVDCAVIGVPDEAFGESLLAIIQPEVSVTIDPDGVQRILRTRLTGYKVPRAIIFETELPREDSGKVFKGKLREPYWRSAGRQIGARPQNRPGTAFRCQYMGKKLEKTANPIRSPTRWKI